MLLRSIAVWGELHALNTWMPPKGLSTRQKWKLRHLQTLCRGPWPTTGPLGHACVSQQPWRSNLRAALLTLLHGLFPVSFERLQLPNKWNQCSCQLLICTQLLISALAALWHGWRSWSVHSELPACRAPSSSRRRPSSKGVGAVDFASLTKWLRASCCEAFAKGNTLHCYRCLGSLLQFLALLLQFLELLLSKNPGEAELAALLKTCWHGKLRVQDSDPRWIFMAWIQFFNEINLLIYVQPHRPDSAMRGSSWKVACLLAASAKAASRSASEVKIWDRHQLDNAHDISWDRISHSDRTKMLEYDKAFRRAGWFN